MALSDAIKNLCDGKLTLRDGTPTTPLTCELRFENGDFSMSGFMSIFREVQAYLSRGCTLAGLRHTSLVFPSGSFGFQLSELTENTVGNALDMIRGTGAYSTRVPTNGLGDVETLDLIWDIEGTDLGDDGDHQAVIPMVLITFDIAEGDPSQVTCNWTCYDPENIVFT